MTRTDEEVRSILINALKLENGVGILENEIFELKEGKFDFSYEKLYKYFSALSNEANLRSSIAAWLILGISDNGDYIGSQFLSGDGEISNCKLMVGNKTNNRISFIDIYVLMVNSKRIVMFEIPPAIPGVPTTVDGIAYGRDGSSLVVLSEEKRNRILSQPRFIDWSRGIVYDATMDDLDIDAIDIARKNYITKNPRLEEEVSSWDNERFLHTVQLMIDEKITRAALILLGKRESRYLLSPADISIRWILKDKDGETLDYYIGDGPFIIEINEIYHKIRNLKYRYIPEGTLFPVETDMYEEYIIREALNNAIAHQDYNLCVRISIIEMPDHLIFYNAGSFMPGTVENVISTNIPNTRYRNQYLVNAMRQLGLIDTAWTGIAKMFRLQRKKFFPMPEYIITDHDVTVTIYGSILNIDFAKILSTNGDLTLNEVLILDKVSKKQSVSIKEADILRKKKLIEGKYPNIYISRSVANKTNMKAQYTISRGLDKKYYQDLILAGIDEHDGLNRKDINELLWKKLPDIYDTDEKKRKKITNLLSEMNREGIITSNGRGKGSIWKKNDK